MSDAKLLALLAASRHSNKVRRGDNHAVGGDLLGALCFQSARSHLCAADNGAGGVEACAAPPGACAAPLRPPHTAGRHTLTHTLLRP